MNVENFVKQNLTFPILRTSLLSPRLVEQFDEAVDRVFAGIEAGSIRNVVLQEAKSFLSRIVQNAWEKHVSEPFFWGGTPQPDDVRELHFFLTSSPA